MGLSECDPIVSQEPFLEIKTAVHYTAKIYSQKTVIMTDEHMARLSARYVKRTSEHWLLTEHVDQPTPLSNPSNNQFCTLRMKCCMGKKDSQIPKTSHPNKHQMNIVVDRWTSQGKEDESCRRGYCRDYEGARILWRSGPKPHFLPRSTFSI